MDDIIWFPVTDEGKKRFERICSLTGQSKEEWFERALLDTEIEVAAFSEKARCRRSESARKVSLVRRQPFLPAMLFRMI